MFDFSLTLVYGKVVDRCASQPAQSCLQVIWNTLKVAPYNFSKTLNGTLVYNIFRQIYHLDESKQLIMINQRLEFMKRQRTIFKLTLL